MADAKCIMDNNDYLQPSSTTISADICINLWKNDFAKVSKNLVRYGSENNFVWAFKIIM